MVFNQYGEGIREIMRSPYGHIVYDSNPYLYLPVDFCGGLLDQVTSLVHMANGKVYDPLIGQWMSPIWENLIERIHSPTQLHLYRFNGNDPINGRPQNKKPTGRHYNSTRPLTCITDLSSRETYIFLCFRSLGMAELTRIRY